MTEFDEIYFESDVDGEESEYADLMLESANIELGKVILSANFFNNLTLIEKVHNLGKNKNKEKTFRKGK